MSQLRSIEIAAGAAFREIGMAMVADDAPMSVEALGVYQRDGRAWVATDDDRPVAYLVVDLVDDNAHIEQVSVHPDHGHQGLGSALIDTAEAWARGRGCAALTLTTFAVVPWNAPYYRRLGFVPVPASEMGEGLAAIRAHEAALGLDAWPRVAMVRQVGQVRSGGSERGG